MSGRRVERQFAPRIGGTQFTLTGFGEERGFRVFRFSGADADRVSHSFTVQIDLALSRRYGIPMQELPLLCRRLLETRNEIESMAALTFDEAEMATHVRLGAEARAAAAGRRKQPRRPATTPAPSPWRGARP